MRKADLRFGLIPSLWLRAEARRRIRILRKAGRLKHKAERRPAYMAWYDAWLAKYRARHQA